MITEITKAEIDQEQIVLEGTNLETIFTSEAKRSVGKTKDRQKGRIGAIFRFKGMAVLRIKKEFDILSNPLVLDKMPVIYLQKVAENSTVKAERNIRKP